MTEQTEKPVEENTIPATDTTVPAEQPVVDPAPETPAPAKPEVTIGTCPTVTLTETYRSPVVAKSLQIPLFSLRFNSKELEALVASSPQYQVNPSEASASWVDALQYGLRQTAYQDGQLGSIGQREGSEWQQTVKYENIPLRAGKPALATFGAGQPMIGERAVATIQQAMGLGSYIQIPIWHSGLWITFRVPTDIELLNLETLIGEEKIRLGMETRGLIYSNYSAYMINHLINFALDHVYDCTLKDYTPDRLRKLIRVSDIPLIAWGLACSIFPNGYAHNQPCVVNPEVCRHITKETLYLPKINWVDNSALSKAQRKHMANRVARYEEKDILAYQNEGRAADGKAYSTGAIGYALRVPSIEDYVNNGYEWINDISDAVDRLFDKNLSETKKEAMMIAQSNLTSLRQYAHWVKHITYTADNGDVVEVTDPADLKKLIEILCTDSEFVKNFMESVADYIEQITISIIAIPRTRCPSCQKVETKEAEVISEDEKKHPYLVPLDAVNLFFTLGGYRTVRAKMS